jgi:hypothetical protein
LLAPGSTEKATVLEDAMLFRSCSSAVEACKCDHESRFLEHIEEDAVRLGTSRRNIAQHMDILMSPTAGRRAFKV